MSAQCCKQDWFCPVNRDQHGFAEEQFSDFNAKGSQLGKSLPSTTLFQMSTAPTSQSSVHGTSQVLIPTLSAQQLPTLDQLILTKQRSCSILQAQVKNRQRVYGRTLLISRENFKKLNENYKRQMQQLDQIEFEVSRWEKKRRMLSPKMLSPGLNFRN